MSHQWSVFGEDQDGFQLVGEDSLSSSSTDSNSSASHRTPSTASATASTTTHSTRVSSTHSNLASSRVSPQDSHTPPLARPSRERESYLTSLRRAFSRRTSAGRDNVQPSPPPPPSSRRASASSEESSQEAARNVDVLGGLFTAALSFGNRCDRRAAAARTVTDLPLSAAYNHRATWGDAVGRHRIRRRAGRRRASADSSDEESGSTPVLRDAFGFPAVLNALFGSRRRH